MQNCSKAIENYCFKHKILVGFRGICPLIPTAALPLGQPLGAPPTTIYYELTVEFDGERMLTVGQHLAKLWTEV